MKINWENILSREIAIKYKAGIYSLCHLFYIAMFLITRQKFHINLVQLAQIVLLAWFVNHIEIYLFGNFDEADRLTRKWWLSSLICSVLYMLSAYWLNWFGGNGHVLIGFGVYQLFCYWGIYINNKIKRHIDSKQLNHQLDQFKKRKEPGYDK